MALARGKYALMVDADGATTFSELDRVWSKLRELEKQNNGLAMVAGSRRMGEEDAKV